KIDSAGIMSTLAGEDFTAGAGGPLAYARLVHPRDAVFDRAGTLYILENGVPTLRKTSPSGLVTVLDGLYDAQSIAADPQGNVYISDQGTDAVWKLDTEGKLTRYAGRGGAGFDGDGGPAVQARL